MKSEVRDGRVREKLRKYKEFFEDYLKNSTGRRNEGAPEKLSEAMDYSLFAGGKRLRPVLCLAAAERCGCAPEDALPLALGFEMLHTATLIHDDLPCMDDDDMRRGKPSSHAVFGETMAVLAGDALLALSLSYPLAHTTGVKPEKLLKSMKIFSAAIGPSGVCGGQVLDMDAATTEGDLDYVKKVAALKTGALIRAAVVSGAALGTGDESVLDCYHNYGTHLGAAFQIVDDILDVSGTAEELGKTPGKDLKQEKATHVSAYGLDEAKRMAGIESRLAREHITKILPDRDFLLELPGYLLSRTN